MMHGLLQQKKNRQMRSAELIASENFTSRAQLVEYEADNFTESSSQLNKTWINTAKDRGRWTVLEEKYTMTSEERQENNAGMRMRRNSQSRPARYVNGVRLSDEEVANIT